MQTEVEIVAVDEKGGKNMESWKIKILVAGGVLGVLTGLGAAFLLIQRSEKTGQMPKLSAMEGVKVGVMIFGLLRQISQL